MNSFGPSNCYNRIALYISVQRCECIFFYQTKYTLLLFPLQCNEAYSSSDTLLTEGFGGTTVLTCRLQELNAITFTLNRRKRESNETASDDQGAGNSNSTEQDTNSTITTTPKSTTTTTPKPVSTKQHSPL